MSQSRDQTTLINQLVRYIKLLPQEVDVPKKAQPWNPVTLVGKLVKKEEKVDDGSYEIDGLCFGFAVCDATFHRLGKTNWWLHVKEVMANWDGSSAALEKRYRLRDSEKEESLKYIFERVLNYILFNYASFNIPGPPSFFPTKNSQINFLKPISELTPAEKEFWSGFELSDRDEKNKPIVRKIQSRASFGGYFEQNTWAHFLKQNHGTIASSISLLHNHEHSCALCADEKFWYFYNSDDREGKPRIYSLEDTDQLASLIQQEMGKSIGLQCASYDKNIQLNTANVYSEPLDEKNEATAQLLKEKGLHLMASYAPHALLALIKNPPSSETRKNIAQALVTKDVESWTGFDWLVERAPTTIPALLDLARTDSDIRESLTQALIAKAGESWTGFDRLVYHLPATIPVLFDLAKTNSDIRESLAQALIAKAGESWSGFDRLVYIAPATIPALLQLATTNSDIRESIAQALIERNNDGWTGFHLLARYASDTIPALVYLARANLDIRKKVAEAISLKDANGSTGFDILGESAPGSIVLLIDLVKIDSDIRKNLAEVMIAKNGLDLVRYYASTIIPVLLDHLINDIETCKTAEQCYVIFEAVFKMEFLSKKPNIDHLRKTFEKVKEKIAKLTNEDKAEQQEDPRLRVVKSLSFQTDSTLKDKHKMCGYLLKELIHDATSSEAVRSIVNEALGISYLHQSKGWFLSEVRREKWHGKLISHTLAEVLVDAKQRIVDLAKKESYDPKNKEKDIEFLNEKISFFEKDYVSLYKKNASTKFQLRL